MIDLLNKIETGLESKTPNILEKNVDNTQENTQDNSNQDNLIDNKDISFDNAENFKNSSTSRIEPEEQNSEVVNCLALTLKKDYNLSIVKNVVIKTFKNTWRVAISFFTLNFLKFFL